jgi:succinate dehydrogenase / fumarate reductase membrane anchor subunit
MQTFRIQRYTAVALLVFMTLHMVVVHYPPGHLDFSRVLDRLANPIWKVIDIAFLLTVLVHAVLGAYDVLVDVEGIARYRQVLAVLGVVITLVAFVYGTITVLSFNPAAAAMVP